MALALGLGSFLLSIIAILAWARIGPVGWPARESLTATAAGGLTLLMAVVALVARSARRPLAVVGLVAAGFGLFLLWGFAGALVATRPPPRAPLSRTEAADFAALLAARVTAGDAAFFDGHLDVDGMIARVGLKRSEARDARKGWVQSQSRGKSMGSEVVKAASGGAYTLVRVRELEGQWTALLRLVTPEGGLNIHELFLSRGADGQVAFDDVHMYMGDLRLSAMMTRMVGDPALTKEVNALGELLRAGKFDEVLTTYAGLPRDLQRRREVRVLRLFAAARLGEEAPYLEAIRELEEIAPSLDAAVALTLFDLHYQREAFDRCAADLEAIDAALGGDAWVGSLFCRVELARKRPAEALRRARAAAKQEPGLRFAHAVLLEAGLAAADPVAIRDALERLEQQFHEDWGGVPEDPRFEAFVASPEFEAWSATRATPAGTR